MPKKQTEWTRAFNERAYDRISVTVPKGLKRRIEAHAKQRDKSINKYINELIRGDMGLTKDEWKQTDKGE